MSLDFHGYAAAASAAYQVTAIAWQVSWNEMVRPAARAVRLRAWPARKTCLLSSIAALIRHC